MRYGGCDWLHRKLEARLRTIPTTRKRSENNCCWCRSSLTCCSSLLRSFEIGANALLCCSTPLGICVQHVLTLTLITNLSWLFFSNAPCLDLPSITRPFSPVTTLQSIIPGSVRTHRALKALCDCNVSLWPEQQSAAAGQA